MGRGVSVPNSKRPRTSITKPHACFLDNPLSTISQNPGSQPIAASRAGTTHAPCKLDSTIRPRIFTVFRNPQRSYFHSVLRQTMGLVSGKTASQDSGLTPKFDVLGSGIQQYYIPVRKQWQLRAHPPRDPETLQVSDSRQRPSLPPPSYPCEAGLHSLNFPSPAPCGRNPKPHRGSSSSIPSLRSSETC